MEQTLSRRATQRQVPYMPQPDALTVEAVCSETALQALAGEWADLLGRSESNSLFLTHTWLTAWWRHFGRMRRPLRQATLFVLTVRQHGRLCGVAPLMLDVERYLGISARILRFLGHGVSDYVDFLLLAEDREAILQAMVRYLVTHAASWDVLDLRDVAGTSPHLPILRDILGAAGFVYHTSDDHACPFLPVQESWDDYYQSRFNRHHRKEHRREWRALATVGQPCVRFITSLDTEPDLLERLAAMDQHHPEAGPQRAAFFALEDYRGFFEELLPQAAQQGWLTLALLECDGLAVAYYLGFHYNRRYYIYITSYHGAFSRFGVGKLLMLRMLEQYWSATGDEIDFLRGDEPHKNRWATHLRYNQRLLVWQRSGRSRRRQQMWFVWLPALLQRSPRLHGFLRFFSESTWPVMMRWAGRRLARAVFGQTKGDTR